MTATVASGAAQDGLCHVCGGHQFEHASVLWTGLVDEWGLSADEAGYIDEQQGTHCVSCGSNLRCVALARAIVRRYGFSGPLTDFVQQSIGVALRVLEINEAGMLHPVLRLMPRHQFVAYPAADMTALPYGNGTFDLVVHSDTLEHVDDPVQGLRECRRVLAETGALVFTVPIVLGRLTRTRRGLPPSYHGLAEARDPHMLVHTEFGADVWTMILSAGFTSCEVVPFRFPAGLAIVARP
jgi:SAM-dependent methyltransferase